VIHRLYLAHGVRKVREIEANIKVCDKTTWAIETDGKRHLLGSSAFYTRPAAERVRLAALQKVVQSNYLRYRMPWVWNPAARELRTIH
jgi:hypothetical protein